MIHKFEILNKLRENNSELNKFGVVRIGLFSSVIRDETYEDSDVDVLINFEPELETFENYMNTCNFPESVFKGFKLDIVTENGLRPFIGSSILKEVEYA